MEDKNPKIKFQKTKNMYESITNQGQKQNKIWILTKTSTSGHTS